MRTYYEDLNMYDDDLEKICNEVINFLKSKKITLAVANAILKKTIQLLDEKIKFTNLDSLIK